MRTIISNLICAILFACASQSVIAATIFSDDFNAGASALWGNEQGDWRDIGGVYQSTSGSYAYSSVPFDLTNFTVDVDINAVRDGGIFLRSEYNGGAFNGVSLITGGRGGNGTGIYWHTWQNGVNSGILNPSGPLFASGDNIQIRIVVQGDTYSAFFNGALTPATTLTTSLFSSGQVALFNNALGQSFDNITVSAVPIPAAVWLLGSGLIGLVGVARRRKS